MVPWLSEAADQLSQKSWCCLPSALPVEMTARLNHWIDEQKKLNLFQLAGVGRAHRFQNNETIRRDQILWLPEGERSQVLSDLQGIIEALRQGLNQQLFTGFDRFEGHFSIYSAGSFYKRHLDAFRDDDSRSMTMIIYLNEIWCPEDGGELRLELAAGQDVLIPPQRGTVVLFDARQFFHEVLPARRERRSFTGWFNVRSLK